MIELVMKVLSLVSFYFLNGMLLLLTKAVGSNKSGKYIYLSLIIIVLITFPSIYGYVIYEHGYRYAFGVFPDTFDQVKVQVYTLIVPMTVLETNASDVVSVYPTIVNTGCALISMSTLFFMRKMKINW